MEDRLQEIRKGSFIYSVVSLAKESSIAHLKHDISSKIGCRILDSVLQITSSVMVHC